MNGLGNIPAWISVFGNDAGQPHRRIPSLTADADRVGISLAGLFGIVKQAHIRQIQGDALQQK